MSSEDYRHRRLHFVLGIVAVFVLLYSLLITARPLLGVEVILWLLGVYLLWRFLLLTTRFVRAVERIADALEESR